MSKRRTRKEKIRAKHDFSISWKPGEVVYDFPKAKAESSLSVNRQIPNSAKTSNAENLIANRPENMDLNKNLSTIKKDIIKSLLIASFIIGTELVIYLFL